jgi:hypothetical protein
MQNQIEQSKSDQKLKQLKNAVAATLLELDKITLIFKNSTKNYEDKILVNNLIAENKIIKDHYKDFEKAFQNATTQNQSQEALRNTLNRIATQANIFHNRITTHIANITEQQNYRNIVYNKDLDQINYEIALNRGAVSRIKNNVLQIQQYNTVSSSDNQNLLNGIDKTSVKIEYIKSQIKATDRQMIYLSSMAKLHKDILKSESKAHNDVMGFGDILLQESANFQLHQNCERLVINIALKSALKTISTWDRASFEREFADQKTKQAMTANIASQYATPENQNIITKKLQQTLLEPKNAKLLESLLGRDFNHNDDIKTNAKKLQEQFSDKDSKRLIKAMFCNPEYQKEALISLSEALSSAKLEYNGQNIVRSNNFTELNSALNITTIDNSTLKADLKREEAMLEAQQKLQKLCKDANPRKKIISNIKLFEEVAAKQISKLSSVAAELNQKKANIVLIKHEDIQKTISTNLNTLSTWNGLVHDRAMTIEKMLIVEHEKVKEPLISAALLSDDIKRQAMNAVRNIKPGQVMNRMQNTKVPLSVIPNNIKQNIKSQLSK